MARKSAKNKKALKRKNEASKRSRVLKQRQDYTVGGRVKAFNGLPDGVQAAMDAAKKAEEARTRATQSTQGTEVPGQGGQSDIVPTPVKTRPDLTGVGGPGFGTGLQLPTSPVPSDIVPTTRTPTPEPTGVVQPGVGKGIELPKKEEPEQQVLNFGTRYDGKEFTPQNYERISREGGDPNQDKFITNDEWVNWMLDKGPDEGVSEQGIPFGTIWREKLAEAAKQGALTNATREKLNQRLGVDTVTTDRTYGSDVSFEDSTPPTTYAAQQAAAQQAAAKEDDETDDREIIIDHRLDFLSNPDTSTDYITSEEDGKDEDGNWLDGVDPTYVGTYSREKLNFSSIENKIFDLNMDRWLVTNPQPPKLVKREYQQDIYGVDQGNIMREEANPAYTSWLSNRNAQHNDIVKKVLALDKRQALNPDGTPVVDSNGNPVYDYVPVEQTQFTERTEVPYRVPATDADDVSDIAVSKLTASDYQIDETTGEFVRDDDGNLIPVDRPRISADTFQMDRFERDDEGNIKFDDAGKPIRALRDVAALTDEEKVAVEDIDADTVITKDDPSTPGDDREISLTDPSVVATNAKALGVSAPAMRGFLAAEANYFNKYPEVRNAIKRGEATDLFDYHRRIGKGLGYTLDFDATKYAVGTEEKLAEASEAALTATTAAARDTAQEEAAKAAATPFIEDPRSQIDPVTGEPVLLSPTPDAEKQTRKAILEEEPAEGDAALIEGEVGYEASKRRKLKGKAAEGNAVSFLREIVSIPGQYGVDPVPPDIAEAILDDPAKVTAQVDTEPVEVQAAIAALPNEALVSVQIESLLAGIDEGVTPTWARPAVQLVNSRMSARGLDISTVGRDALFNAIIQTALPIAQSNAAALQQRATQNLSNEQQANLQQASQEMQLRLTNLANRQEAGSQTAQLAQQINLTQGQFTQQAQLTQSEQAQQVRIQSLQNEQQAAMANLGNDQQIEMANLQVEAERLGANQSAINQQRLAEFNVAASFLDKNAAFKQQMEVANLSNDQQMRLAFLSAKNQASSENLSAAQQTELANLSKTLEVNKITANLAQQMNLAQLNVDQQRAIQNAATVANIDLTKFGAAQQVELSNSKFMQTSTLQDLNNRQQAIMQDATTLASMDLQEADSLTKVSIENARNFLQMDMTNLNNEQQAYMLDSQQRQQRMLSDAAIQNAARQFNASSNLQTQQYVTSLSAQLNQFNSQQVNAIEQFNSAETNRVAAINAGNELQAEQFMAQIQTQIRQFNSNQDAQIEQFNTSNSQAIEQSNVEWRRKTNLADSAAQNAANQQQSSYQFDLDKTALSQAWQSLRDQAAFDMTEYQNDKERQISAINAVLSNEAFMTSDAYSAKREKLLATLGTFSESIRDIRDLEFLMPDELMV